MSTSLQKKSSTAYFDCNTFIETEKMIEKQKLTNTKSNLNSEHDLLMMDSVMVNSTRETPKDTVSSGRSHNNITRTISHPNSHTQDSHVATLVTTIIENLGNINLHRKLERTQSEPLPQQVNTSRYKTELCRPFEEAGECKYGEKCQFAHGFRELRNLQRHPKYKTEYCRTFHSVGFCPYGPRCHFVHNVDEVRSAQQMSPIIQNHSVGNCVQADPQLNHSISLGPITKQKTPTVAGNHTINHSLPLSPPLSMSTGSDRESPTGSLSLSPTNSITSFVFNDQISPSYKNLPTAFSYLNNTPPESPNAASPVNTPPPNVNFHIEINPATRPKTQSYIKPIMNSSSKCYAEKMAENVIMPKSCSPSVTSTISNGSTLNMSSVINNNDNEIEARLPVFNRFISCEDFYPSNLAT